MADTDGRPESPVPGLYDHLLSGALEHEIQQLADPGLAVIGDVDADDAHTAIAQYLEHVLAASLSNVRGRDGSERRRRLVGRILEALAEELGPEWSHRLNLADPLRRLLAIHAGVDGHERPDTPLARSALLTGTRIDPSLASQLSKEIAAADRVDILCSFIKWSGLRLLLGALERLTSTRGDDGPRLRVISTSYKPVLSDDQAALIEQMAAAVAGHSFAGVLLAEGIAEGVVRCRMCATRRQGTTVPGGRRGSTAFPPLGDAGRRTIPVEH